MSRLLRFARDIRFVNPRDVEPFDVSDGAAAFVAELNAIDGRLHQNVCPVLRDCFGHSTRPGLYTAHDTIRYDRRFALDKTDRQAERGVRCLWRVKFEKEKSFELGKEE